MTYKSGKIGFAEAVVHTVFQFFFLFDVLDAMYLATEKWGKREKEFCNYWVCVSVCSFCNHISDN